MHMPYVFVEPSLSDHRYTCFQIGNLVITRVTFKVPKRTTASHNDNLRANHETMFGLDHIGFTSCGYDHKYVIVWCQ
jgi:hypothetical protein